MNIFLLANINVLLLSSQANRSPRINKYLRRINVRFFSAELSMRSAPIHTRSIIYISSAARPRRTALRIKIREMPRGAFENTHTRGAEIIYIQYSVCLRALKKSARQIKLWKNIGSSNAGQPSSNLPFARVAPRRFNEI